MTDQLRQAAQQARQALETLMIERESIYDKAITALNEALAREHAMHDLVRLGQEIEQEPVAWMFEHSETGRMNYVSNDGRNTPELFLKTNLRYALVCPLYTAPPQRLWVDLTDEDWEKVANRKNTVLDTFEQGATWAAYKLERRNK